MSDVVHATAVTAVLFAPVLLGWLVTHLTLPKEQR